VTGPLLLIVIGVLFLLNNLFPDQFRFGRMWPVILIVIGITKVIEYFRSQPPPDRTIDRPIDRPVSRKEDM
jgi:hypothetical protein